MKASKLKTEALAWLRYGRRLPIVCTEVGGWNADVLGVSQSMSVEVETKVSRADIRADFKNKRAKHFLYGAGGASAPNYFYFLVPESLKDAALELVPEGNPKAGVAYYHEEPLGILGTNITVAKPAQKLHAVKPSNRLVRTAMMRMSSELCGVSKANEELQDLVEVELRNTMQAIRLAAFRASGALDVEAVEADLNMRARELVMAVRGEKWENLTASDQEYWSKAAKRLLDVQEPTMREWENAAYRF